MNKYTHLIVIEWRRGNYFFPLKEGTLASMREEHIKNYIEAIILPSLQEKFRFKKCVIYFYRGTGNLTPMNIDKIINP